MLPPSYISVKTEMSDGGSGKCGCWCWEGAVSSAATRWRRCRRPGTRSASAAATSGAGLLRCRLERLACPEDALPLLERFDVVLNCVGILRERWRGESYAAVHQRAPALLAAACRARGLRYLHVSALGLRHPHRSGFLTSKLAGEQAVVAAGGDFRIVRPSLLDGRGGFGALWLRALAALPLHFHARAARGRIAALDVAELGEALAALCTREIAANAPVSERCFELGGAAGPGPARLPGRAARKRAVGTAARAGLAVPRSPRMPATRCISVPSPSGTGNCCSTTTCRSPIACPSCSGARRARPAPRRHRH